MRQSKEAAAQTRQRIVKTAARAYRRAGIGGIGLAGLMAEAGLTHGGFYKHFASKDAMVAEALGHALAESRRGLEAAVAAAPPGERLQALIDTYLSEAHRDRPERGCPLAALGSEAARGDPAVRAAVAEGYRQFAAFAVAQIPAGPASDDGDAERLALGQALAAALVGTLMLARAQPARQASDALLRSSRAALLRTFGGRTG